MVVMTKWFELASTTYNPIDPAANGSHYKTERAGEEDAQQRALIRIWREDYRSEESSGKTNHPGEERAKNNAAPES